MMKATIQALPDATISKLLTDSTKIPEFVRHHSEEEEPARLQIKGSLAPIHYLLTGYNENQARDKYDWKSPRKIIRLEHATRKAAEYFEIITESTYTVVRSGKIEENGDVYPALPHEIPMTKLRANEELMATYGITQVDTHGSREEIADYIFDAILSKMRGGFKFVFPETLPPPESDEIEPIMITVKHPKRKLAGSPEGEPQAKKAKKEEEQQQQGEGEERSGTQEQQQQPTQEGEEKKEMESAQPAAVAGTEEGQEGKEEGKGKEGTEQQQQEEEEFEEKEVQSMPHPSKLKVKDLKAELQARDLPTTGRKDILVARLCLALCGVPLPGNEAGIQVYDPMDLLVTGGLPIPNEGDVFEYGSARALDSAQLKELDISLQNFTEEQLRTYFSIDAMKSLGVGPDSYYDAVDETSLWETTLKNFYALRDYIHSLASKPSSGILIY